MCVFMREIEDLPGISIGGMNMNDVRYADDTALMADSVERLQAILDRVVSESERKGLFINIKKTFCMVISKQKAILSCNIFINEEQVKQLLGKFDHIRWQI